MTDVLATGAELAARYRTHLDVHDRAGADLQELARRSRTDPALQSVLAAPLLLRPMFLSAAEREQLEGDLGALQQLLLSLPERLYDGDVAQMCADLGFSPVQTMAIEETWRDTDVLLARADLIRGADGFRVIEYNLHSSLGGIDSGPWHQQFRELDSFASFATEHELTFVDPMDGVAGMLRSAARDRGLGGFPSLAIVDWPTSYAQLVPRLDRLARLFARRGFDAFHCHAGELQLRGERLFAHGRPVDVLYRVFLVEDVVQDPALLMPVLAAHDAGSVVLAMSFVAELAGNKGCLALLADPRHAAAFTDTERDLVRRLVPPTRWVRDTLRADLIARRGRLVLKPAGGYSAHGVTVGASAEPPDWIRAVDDAVAAGGYVVQDRVDAVPELVPTAEGEQAAMDTNWGVFLAGNRYNGAMIRAVPASDHQVITTSTGAAIGACFVQRAPCSVTRRAGFDHEE
jgi:hypothetical protein